MEQIGQAAQQRKAAHKGQGKRSDGRIAPFAKTKLCRFEAMGMCTKGVDCPFAHGSRELNPLPDLRCTRICKTLIETGMCNSATCTYAHNRDELRLPGASRPTLKTKQCKYVAENGTCYQGAWCQFAHNTEEQRDMRSQKKRDRRSNDVQQQQQQQQIQSQCHDSLSGGLRDVISTVSRDEPDEVIAPHNSQNVAAVAILSPPPGLEMPKKDSANFNPVYIKIGEGFQADSPQLAPLAEQPGVSWIDLIDSVLGNDGGHGPVLSGAEPSVASSSSSSSQYWGSGSLFSASPWLPDDRSLAVDQQDGTLNISSLALTEPAIVKPMRSVRTSETTLCSLSDVHRHGAAAAKAAVAYGPMSSASHV